MADQILINPEGFQKEIDTLTSTKEAVSDNILSIETDGLELETVTQLNDIISKLSSVTKSYKKLLAQDAKNLEVIKSEWMALDSFIGLHGEWISGSNQIGKN